MSTIRWYDDNADDFTSRTMCLDMTQLYQPFLKEVNPGGHILDAGCGPGRDTKAFQELGYKVTAIDASPVLTEKAMVFIGQAVECMTFQEMTWENAFDGIWACASLLHVPSAEMQDVFGRFEKALKSDGVWYFSFKYGQGERWKEGRFFNDYMEADLNNLIKRFPSLSVHDSWMTEDVRKDRPTERWINVLVRKVKTP